LTNNREVTSFIDDVTVRTEEEKEHNKVVEEVMKRLVENNLYKTRRIQVEGYRSRIFRSSNWVRQNQDRGGEGDRSVRLTNPKES